MAKSWKRMEVFLGLMVLGVGGIILAVAGIWIYVSATAVPLHPEAQAVPSAAQSEPSRQWTGAVERARQIMRAEAAAQNLPGVSVAVGIGGDIAWAEGFGFADLDTRATITPSTRFRIGTASTALTSAAAGLLVEQGRLNLDEQIQAYVPEFPKKEWPMTLRQVMGQVSGLRNDSGDESPLFSQHCSRAVDALPFFADASLRFEPGTEFRYSRFSWIVVSAAIEAAANEGLLTFMDKHVFEPLRMADTIPETTEPVPNSATSYFPRFAADPRYGPDLMRPLDVSCYSGTSAFLSTPSDLVRFGMAIAGGKLLKPETVQMLQTSQRLKSGQETGYGLGWDLENVTVAGQSTQWVGYDGDLLGGPLSTLAIFPERKLVVSVISNTSYADTAGIAVKIADAFAAGAPIARTLRDGVVTMPESR